MIVLPFTLFITKSKINSSLYQSIWKLAKKLWLKITCIRAYVEKLQPIHCDNSMKNLWNANLPWKFQLPEVSISVMLGNHYDFCHRNNPASETKKRLKHEMSVTLFIHSILSSYVPLTRAEGDDYQGADCSTECTGRDERFQSRALTCL